MRQQELVSLVRIARAAEAGELAHGPQPAAVPSRMNAAGVWIYAGHPKGFGAGVGGIERGVDRLHLLLGIVEADVAQLAFVVFLAPLRDFLPQEAQLRALFFDRGDELAVSGRLGTGAFQFRHLVLFSTYELRALPQQLIGDAEWSGSALLH